MFYYITLNLCQNSLKKSYETTFFNGKMSWLIKEKRTVFRACDELKVQKYIMSLSGVVQVLQYVKRLYIDSHQFLILFLSFEIILLVFVCVGLWSSPQFPPPCYPVSFSSRTWPSSLQSYIWGIQGINKPPLNLWRLTRWLCKWNPRWSAHVPAREWLII